MGNWYYLFFLVFLGLFFIGVKYFPLTVNFHIILNVKNGITPRGEIIFL